MYRKTFAKILNNATFRKNQSILLTLVLTCCMILVWPSIAQASKTNSNHTVKSFASTNTVNQKAIYVALGDSVPAGYGLSNTKDGCVKLFSDTLKDNGYPNAMMNYAVSGITTDTLLSSLQNMQTANPESLTTIKNASIITVNIGGNNVLGPLIEAINENLKPQLKSLGITNIATATTEQLTSIGTSLFLMTIDDAHMAKIEQGTQKFALDFPKIIKWLKTNAPNANIIVNTIYNPIPSYLSFYNASKSQLNEMNTLIMKNAKQSGYYVADIHSVFLKEQTNGTQIINLNLGQYKKSPVSIDIHPNAAGHKLIAQIQKDIYLNIPCIVKTNPNTPVTAMLSLSGEIENKTNLSARITEQKLNAVIEKAQSEAKQSDREHDGIKVVFQNNNAAIKNVSVTIDDSAIDLLKSEAVKQITIGTKSVQFILDKEAILKMKQKIKGDVIVKICPVTKFSKAAKKLLGNRPAYKITMEDMQGNVISDLGKGKITIAIHDTATSKYKTSKLCIVSINSKGKTNLLASSSTSDGWVSCTSHTLSTYGIGYRK